MERIVVVGTSGSGKTTVARELAEILDIPHLEMDAVAHRDGWDSTPKEVFVHELHDFTNATEWVVDGNYSSRDTPEVVWPRADTFVWLDLPRSTVMRRVVGRTLKRVVTREKLWGEVVEPWTNLYSRDPYQNIMLWAWKTYDHNREKYEQTMTDGSWAHAEVHRLRSKSDVNSFLSLARSIVD